MYELARIGSVNDRTGVAGRDEAARLAAQVRALVANLREFARGVYPAVLDTSGLSVAIEALVDDAPVVVTLDCRLDRRPSVDVERTAYLLIDDAVMRAEDDLDIAVASNERSVVVKIAGDARPVREDLVDRVGALGGTVSVEQEKLQAVLPCK